MNALVYLLGAITFEVIATSALRATEGFTKWVPSMLVIVGYGLAFWLVSLTVKQIPLGVAYATWSGLGTLGAVAAGIWLYGESFTLMRAAGAVLVILGAVLLNLDIK